MTTFLSVLGALLFLTVIVTIHEFGHFITGKLLGFTIKEFSIGMGPALVEYQPHEIKYALRLLPIGGMCIFDGELGEAEEQLETGEDRSLKEIIADLKNNPEPEEESEEPMTLKEFWKVYKEEAAQLDKEKAELPPREGSFRSMAAWKRLCVVLAGPVFNILTAFLLSLITMCAFGKYLPAVTGTEPGGPAEAAGLMPGDLFISLNGCAVEDLDILTDCILSSDPDQMVMIVERDGQELELIAHNLYNAEEGINILGIWVNYGQKKCSLAESVIGSADYMKEITVETYKTLAGVLVGTTSTDAVTGPVGTVAVISSYITMGIEMILRLGVLISLSLALFNLLPFPALDGGRAVFILFEMITGKQTSEKLEAAVNFAGIVLLLGLMAVITFKDIRNLVG